MPWIETVPERHADARLKAAYEKVRASRGAVANVHEAMSLNPHALETFLKLDLALLHEAPEGRGERGPRLTRRERELVGLVTSATNRDPYGFTHHADAYSRHVTEPALVALVAAGAWRTLLRPEGDGPAHLGARESALAKFAASLASDPASLGEAGIAGLREAGLTDGEILDAVLVGAHVAFVNRVALALGVRPEDASRAFRY